MTTKSIQERLNHKADSDLRSKTHSANLQFKKVNALQDFDRVLLKKDGETYTFKLSTVLSAIQQTAIKKWQDTWRDNETNAFMKRLDDMGNRLDSLEEKGGDGNAKT
jgi:hypothetical protein